MSAPHPDFDPAIDHVVRVDPTKPVAPEQVIRPYEVVGQLKLFKAGLMGQSVRVFSSVKGGYVRSAVKYDEDNDLVVSLDDDDPETAIHFAVGYIYGWHESRGGDPADLDIWLETYAPGTGNF